VRTATGTGIRVFAWGWRTLFQNAGIAARLTIHLECAQVRPVSEGIPFLGFIIRPDRRRVKPRKGIAFARRLRGMARQYAEGEISLAQVTATVQGWVNHLRYGNTVGLRKAELGRISL
jgi:hypothetical protein